MKIVLNRSVSQFQLSDATIERILAVKGSATLLDDWVRAKQRSHKMSGSASRPVNLRGMLLARTDKDLVDAVECLGEGAGAAGSELEVIEIPDSVEWMIGDVCGIEYVLYREGNRWVVPR